jgi:DNA polymerase-3 subunit delta'
MNTTNIIGQSLLVGKMEQILTGGRIVHAYLFTGPAGSGKKTLSSLFAQALICEGQGDKPCNTCRTCRQFLAGSHPDVLWIRKPEDKTGIGVEQIRDMQTEIKVKPFQAGRRVCFIENAHLMTEQAQNALLKTLEEPPPFTLLILLADNSNALLPTILSRCQAFRVGCMAREEVARILISRLSLSHEEAMTYAALSQGIPGRALTLASDEGFRENRDRLTAGVNLAAGGAPYRILELYGAFKDNKANADDLLDILALWFRDLLILKETGNKSLVINQDKISWLQKQLSSFTSRELKDMIENIEQSRRILKSNGNYQLTIENMLLNFQGGAKNAARSRSTD